MGTTGFELSKWYADCVADDGEVIIAYVAKMAWRGLHLQYAGLLHVAVSGTTSSRTSLINVSPPIVSSSQFSWQSDALEFKGQWISRQPVVSKILYDSQAGGIHWECLQPLSDANLSLAGREITGYGYVERLDMTLPPWKMPIDQLNWGRFLGNEHSVVWINWQGEHPLRHVWVDGILCDAPILDDRGLEFSAESSLTLQPNAILRDGILGETVLNVIPKWLGPLPGRVLGMRETKWRSRGELTLPKSQPVRGWAIHEVVQWPK